MHSIGAHQGSGFVLPKIRVGAVMYMVKEKLSMEGALCDSPGDLGVGLSAFFDCRIFHPCLEPLPVLFPLFE